MGNIYRTSEQRFERLIEVHTTRAEEAAQWLGRLQMRNQLRLFDLPPCNGVVIPFPVRPCEEQFSPPRLV